MAQDKEQKLGPKVTYLGQGEDDTTAINIGGIMVMPGDSIDIEDQDQLKALAGNRYFQVAGGPDHKADAEKREKAKVEAEERLHKAQAEQQEKKAKEQQKEQQAKEPPENYKGPERETLERPQRR